jgi:enoyl-[acyl-carrier-protein] reductase (NADH)
MNTDTKNKLPAMKGDTGFGLGFFCGAVLAGVGVFLTTAPEGKKLRDEMIEQFNQHKSEFNLKSLTQELETDPEIEKTVHTIRQGIKKIQMIINPIANKEVDKPIIIASEAKRKRYFKQTTS